jgi:hypothetical protein
LPGFVPGAILPSSGRPIGRFSHSFD